MHEPLATRWHIGRPAILLGLAFLLGTGLGWVVTRPFAGTSSGPVTNADYVSVVAQLFQRDHNQEVARERLALLGSPTVLVEQTLQDVKAGKVKSQSDQAAVAALAQALSPSTSASVTTSSSASTGSSAVQGAATPVSSDQSSTASTSSGQSSWLGPVVAFILAFALGVIVLLRTAGLSLSSLPVLGGLTRGLARPRATERPSRPRPLVASGHTETTSFRRARGVAESKRFEPIVEEEGAAVLEEPFLARTNGRTATLLKPRMTAVQTGRRLSFESLYRLGDEPYDEIHPITDPTSGALVAACGLSSALAIDSGASSRYYAFTAWVQDYVSGEQLRAVGLVTPSAMDRARAQIDEWVRDGQVDEVLPVRNGVTTELATDTIATAVTVADVDRAESGGANEHFTRLSVRFEVSWNDDGA